MLSKIIQFSVQNKLVIGLLVLVWIFYGAYQLSQLPIDAVPDITNNQVQVITTAPALGAEDVERLITFPIEQAISNIPGLKENRSMSRFGLSLVTLVFEDDADVYWARQQVTERLAQVAIDGNASKPELAPVTTGLGEIYQYVIRPRKGFEKAYSLADLRTTQDWVVRRGLLGTPGVADVATFGGDLKQYEVAVDPARLKALNLTISDVFTALSRNNQNTGGAYIEKGPSVLYIRSVGLAKTGADIGQIVVRNTGAGTPILISHVAQVRTGSAIRYGALTMAGQGELAGGIVLMLKGANSSQVIQNVKQRITEIQKSLPRGLVIEPFLDRTKMVNNAIGTVEHNLLEGALIVVGVLILFLGNWRAGFIVASVIPLSMLFAVAMMNLFGVSGNLMSLGALDFGLIVDGAVIIVEAILHHLHASKKYAGVDRISPAQMDGEVTGSATRMMNAAVFGQMIILIVYLPILSLSGIEGKMFKPMAQTVAFAILGAFILSLTYVPMISALLISRKLNHQPTLSDRLMSRIEAGYERLLMRALQVKKILVLAAFALLAVAVGLFTRMGGEFIPQLEEGDFAVETRLLVGTNLSTTIEAISRVSEHLKANYPEVQKIVARIGSAEIPTDPMPIEGGDMIIVLHDKAHWKSAQSFNELAGKMAASAQAVMPGVTTGFQFPVQMRFNELMTGAKQDVVCKIYGEDLDRLAAYAERLGAISKTVKGTADWYIEKVTGMPQIVIDFNRGEIANYGLSIEEVNRTITAAFAGAAAGQIYEGEKRFDLMVRVGQEGRRTIGDVQNLPISTPSGVQIPLYQVARIAEVEGPNQIQRENTRRRILVGFNVRGRDVQSIVEELQQKVAADLKLDTGYTLAYGGSFQNLQEAKSRLSIAVPVALGLIFALLYFTFSSLKEGALIYTAIPLSAIGGVFALALRGMPFSISAGVGFIALFGVAVLNGIVLISEFNRLKQEGTALNAFQRVLVGTRNRLRPVLMTATVASLGFLPMALSEGAGAEVQRPLATVVIGGLITATLLTLFVLPALYLLLEGQSKAAPKPIAALLVLWMLAPLASQAQAVGPTIPLDKAVDLALQNNRQVQSVRLAEKAGERLQSSAFDPARTLVSADYGQVNSVHTDTRLGISQTISFPAVYTNQRRVLEAGYRVAQAQRRLTENEIRAQVRQVFFEYATLIQRQRLLMYADSLFGLFEAKSNLRFEKGEANVLEKTAALTQRQQITNQLQLLGADLTLTVNSFNYLLQDSQSYIPELDGFGLEESLVPATTAPADPLPALELARQQQQVARFRWQTEKARRLPELIVEYNNQSLIGPQTVNGQERDYMAKNRFHYVSAGLALPLFLKAQNARIAAAKLDWEREQKETQAAQLGLETARTNAQLQLQAYRTSLQYYQNGGLKNAQTIVRTANQQLEGGAIDYLQWVILVNQAISLQSKYIQLLGSYNQAIIQFLKLTNR